MRSLIMVVVVVAACGDHGPVPADSRYPATFSVPVGESCDPDQAAFCADGAAWCADGMCRAFCSAVALPRCAPALDEVHYGDGSGDVCVCVPPR